MTLLNCHYKARLLTNEYTHTYDTDYEDTFYLMIKMDTIQILLSLVDHFDW